MLSAMRRCLAALVAQAVAYSGRTAPGRLAWVDRYLLLKELGLFDDDEPSTTRVFCDIGLGDDATTTLELAEALQQDADAPLVVACEADANRCAGAREACAAAGVVVRQTDGAFLSPKVILRRPSRHRRHAIAATHHNLYGLESDALPLRQSVNTCIRWGSNPRLRRDWGLNPTPSWLVV